MAAFEDEEENEDEDDYTSTALPGCGWRIFIFGWRARICCSNHWRESSSPWPSRTARGETWPTKSSKSSRCACAVRSKSCKSQWRVTRPAPGLKTNVSLGLDALRR